VANFYGHLKYDQQQLRDRVDTSGTRTDRHLDHWTLSLDANALDMFIPGGVSTLNMGWTSGQVGFDDATAQSVDEGSAKTQGRFMKLTAKLTHLQNLSPSNSLYITLSGQWANNNLDSSQKMAAGGPYSVRAYDAGAVSGDSGHLATVEFQHKLDLSRDAQWQAVAFIDNSQVTVNTNTWVAGINTATLSGAGVGLNWSGSDQWNARAYVATPIGSAPMLVANPESVRVWIGISRRL